MVVGAETGGAVALELAAGGSKIGVMFGLDPGTVSVTGMESHLGAS